MTPESHPDFETCKNAMAEMEKTTSLINEKKREFEQAQRLLFVSENLVGGNLGSLRDSSTSLTGKPHDFAASRLILPHACDWCKDLVHMQCNKCTSCGYIAHPNCFKRVPASCGDKILDRESHPVLIRNFRKIVRESVLQVKTIQMDKLGTYETTPFEPRDVLLFNDGLCLLKVIEGTVTVDPALGTGASGATGGGGAAGAGAEQKFHVVDFVKWTSHSETGELIHPASLNEVVAEELFSLANKKNNMLHTFRIPDKEELTSWTGGIRSSMETWFSHVQRHEEHEKKVTEQLTGLHFHITGTVPVASALEKAFTVYIIQMVNERATITILKRYRQLLALHHKLAEIYGEDRLPKFPRKKLVNNTDERFLQKRARQLQEYLEGVAQLKGFLSIPDVRKFLTTTVSAKNENELVPDFVASSSVEQGVQSIIEDASTREDSDEEDEKSVDATANNNNSSNSSISSSSNRTPGTLRRLSVREQALLSSPMNSLSVSTDASSSGGGATPMLLRKNAQPSPAAAKALESCVSLYENASDDAFLKFRRGELLLILNKNDPDWWYVRRDNGEEGYVPTGWVSTE